MIAGQIEIQMLAEIVRLRKQLDEAQDLVERASARMGAAAEFARGALAGIASGLTVGAFVGMIKGSIDAAEALNDLSIKTGMTVERLSALVEIGRTTDTSADTIAAATNRLAKSLAGVDDESKGAGAALAALGLDIESFKQLKADDQLVELAKAMGKFEDGTGKSAVAMTLLGKSGADLLPFLKDLASANELVATTTTEQAQAADQFNDGVTLLMGQLVALQRVAANSLLPTLLQMLQVVTELTALLGAVDGAAEATGGQLAGMSTSAQVLGTVLETIMSLGADVMFVIKGIGRDVGGMAAQIAALLSLDFRGFMAIREALVDDAEAARKALDEYQAKVLGATARMAEASRIVAQYGISTKEAAAETARLDARLGAATQSQLKFSGATKDTTKAQTDAGRKLLSDATARLQVLRQERELGEQLTAGQKFALDAMEALRDGRVRLTDAEKQALVNLIEQIKAEEDLATAMKKATAEAEARADVRRRDSEAADAHIASEQERALQAARGAEEAVRAARLEYQTHGMLRSQIAEVTLQRLLDEQAGLRAGATLYEAKQREINAQRELIGLMRRQEVRDANEAAAKAAADDWQRLADQTGQALADALMEGGRSAGEYLKGLFRSMVLRPIIQAVVSPISGAIAAFLTGGAGGGGGGAGAGVAAGLNNLSTLNSMYSAATGYSSGVNALAGFMGAGTTAGASSVSLAYANAVGAAGGDGLGALIAANNSWGGVAAGNSLGAAAAGEGVAAGSGAAGASGGGSSTMGAWGAYAAYAAMIYAAAQYASKLYGEGFTGSKQLEGKSWYDYSDKAVNLKLFESLGMSEKWSEILSGSVRWNHMFGRAEPRVQGRGVLGTFSGGAFSGEAYADVLEKGGLFRSDKRYTVADTLDSTIDAFFDDAARSVHDQAKKYGEALGLPASLMAGITKDVKVQLTGDLEKDKASIMKALGEYGDALIAGYADQVKPLAIYGETTAQTIARVGGAIVQVNSVLESLGMRALAASIDGGKAAVQLGEMFGGLDKFAGAAGNFLGKYYTEAERAALQTQAVRDAFAQYGATMPATREAFRDLVEAQDLSTEAGRRNYAALMSVADAFDVVAARSEAIADKRGDLEVQLLRAQGDEIGAVALERQRELEALRKLDPALVSLQQSIYAASDAAEQAARMQELQAAIDSELPKFLKPEEQFTHRYGMIIRDLKELAGITVDVGTLQAATKDQILAFASSFVNLSDGASEAELAVVRAAGSLADLKDEAAAAAREFGGIRLRGQAQTSAADKAYRDWLGFEAHVGAFESDWNNGTLPKNLQDYVDGHWGGKENVPVPTQGGIFNMYMMQTDVFENARVQNEAEARESARMGAGGGDSESRGPSEADLAAAEQLRAEQDQLKQMMDMVELLDRIEQSMTDWANNWQLGDLSNLDPTQQYELASDNLSALYADAMAGNWEAFDAWQSAADSFLRESDSYFGGGTGAAADKEAVYGMWEELMALRESMEGLMQRNIEAVKAGTTATSAALQAGNQLAREASTQSKLDASSRIGFRA